MQLTFFSPTRRRLGLVAAGSLAGLLAALLAAPAAAQTQSGTIRFILPNATGSGVDAIARAAQPALAKALNLSRAEVHGVVTFYHDYRREPAGRHVIKVCRAEACQAMGANELVAMIERFLKVKLGQTTADGAITLEAAYCLGNCALSPAVMVDDKLVGRVDAKKFETIVAECRS